MERSVTRSDGNHAKERNTWLARAQHHKELVLGAANLDVNQYGMEKTTLGLQVTTGAVKLSSSSIADNRSIRAATVL